MLTWKTVKKFKINEVCKPIFISFLFTKPKWLWCVQLNVPRDIAAGIFKSFENRISLMLAAAEYPPILNSYI